ncbi:hypothetical protein DPSP01_001247 [Paraphaeosphaeria sporulosa]|uniref:N-acetyltransferase domain-containing protein n=1 Tax=Paraphaeosphaeria sporulosa TaxID=1460663 RepID=A0A177C0W9_9PLEO|nr:uncharacterized protein CC84DRAFT_1180462 [Paraphaeosphaeria sporulosa]OAG00448.1 hypothetical protein CC84DRAFT_1180462 [Paraphaeosphaeria sporulosa]
MPLSVEQCTPQDIPSLVSLSTAAFSAPTPANVFPDTPAVNAFRTKRLEHTLAEDPFAVFTKIVDTDLEDEIVAFAKWMRPHSREEAEKSGYVDLVMSRDELPRECRREVIWGREEVKQKKVEEVMGEKRFYYLQALATHPAHGGRGCAGRLVRWGMQRAEEEGVECYVEAQDSSKPIFLKYGWDEVGVMGEGEEKWATVLVYKPAKGLNK